MSPEQARGEPLDARTDLFSFGLVIYEMATGRRAFGGTTTAVVFDGILNRMPPPALQVNPDLPAELDRIISKAVEKDRQLRYQSALDLATDLQRLKRDSDSSVRGAVAQPSSSATPAYAPASASGIAVANMPSGTAQTATLPQPASSATVPAAASKLSNGLMLAALFIIIVLVATVAYMSGRLQQLGAPASPSQADAPASAPATVPALFRQAQRIMGSRLEQREQVARQTYARVADEYPKSD